jgi:hypothetical protein
MVLGFSCLAFVVTSFGGFWVLRVFTRFGKLRVFTCFKNKS